MLRKIFGVKVFIYSILHYLPYRIVQENVVAGGDNLIGNLCVKINKHSLKSNHFLTCRHLLPFSTDFFFSFKSQVIGITQLSLSNISDNIFLFSDHHWDSRWTTRKAITGQLNLNEVRNFVKGGKEI